MKKLLTILMIALAIPSGLLAQQQEKSSFRGGGGYISYGLVFVNTSSLNSSLRQYDLPEFGSTQMSISGGGGTFLCRIYFGGEGAGQFGLSASNELFRSGISGGYGLFKVGYTLIHKPSVALYPTFGAGGGGFSMRIRSGSSSPVDMDELLIQPGTNIQAGYMLLNLGLNSDFFVGAEKNTKGGLLLGLSAGYQLAPLISQWSHEDQTIPELEKFDPSGFYLRVKLGWALNQPSIPYE